MRDDDVVERLHEIAKHDWKNSHPLDLSDEGLLADLEDRQEGAAERLALDSKKVKKARKAAKGGKAAAKKSKKGKAGGKAAKKAARKPGKASGTKSEEGLEDKKAEVGERAGSAGLGADRAAARQDPVDGLDALLEHAAEACRPRHPSP